MSMKSFTAAAVALSSVAAGALVGPTPAQAVTSRGCVFPRVCLYLTLADWEARRPTAAYQDLTSGWQTLGSGGRGAVDGLNSRNDDSARFHFTNGREICIVPNGQQPLSQYGTVDKIRIIDSASC